MFQNLKTALMLGLTLVIPVAYASDFHEKNNDYSKKLLETYTSEAASVIDQERLASDLKSAQSSYDSAAWNLQRVKNRISSINSQLSDLSSREGNIDGEIESQQSLIRSVKRAASSELGLADATAPELERYANQKRVRYNELRSKRDRLDRKVDRLKRTAPYSEWKEKKKDLEWDKEKAKRAYKKSKDRLKKANRALAQNRAILNQLKKRKAALPGEIESLKTQRQNAVKEVNQAQKALDKCTENCKPQKRNLEKAQNKLNKIKSSIASKKNELEQLKAKIQKTKESIASLETYKTEQETIMARAVKLINQYNSQIDRLETRMAQFRRNQIQPVVEEHNRAVNQMERVAQKIRRAEYLASRMRSARSEISSLRSEREEIPSRMADLRSQRASHTATLPALNDAKSIEQQNLSKASTAMNDFKAAQAQLWTALVASRDLNDQALAAAMSPGLGSFTSPMSAVISSETFKDWEFIETRADEESTLSLCMAETTTESGEKLQVFKMKDATTGIYTRAMVRVTLLDGGDSPVVGGAVTARNLKAEARRFELDPSSRDHNVVVVPFEKSSSVISAIRRLSSINVKPATLDGGAEGNSVKFSLRGSMKTVDKLMSQCR